MRRWFGDQPRVEKYSAGPALDTGFVKEFKILSVGVVARHALGIIAATMPSKDPLFTASRNTILRNSPEAPLSLNATQAP